MLRQISIGILAGGSRASNLCNHPESGAEMQGWGYAWLEAEGQCFWAQSTHPWSDPRFHVETDSSVVRLISAVYERDSRWARKWVRHRVRTNEPLSESAWGLVKVAARRADFGVDRIPDFLQSGAGLAGESQPELRARTERVAPSGVLRDEVLASEVWRSLEAGDLSSAEVIWNLLGNWIVQAQEQSPRIVALPVAAVLVDEQGRALSWGVNSAWDLRTQHAEVNLIHRWRRAGSPGRPAKLWVSRKSCKMCAGAIWDAFSGLEVFPQVAFLEPDEGSLARQTVLDVGTFEYRRARRP